MPDQTTQSAAQKAVKRGTATRKSGRETAARLVAAAHELLETQSLEKFSMRSVAERAGVSLANLQYYFPHREDLARALYVDIGARYEAEYTRCLEGASENPLERFEIVLRWNMQDISKKSTRQFFIQLWALLGSLDDFEGHYLNELYEIDIAQLSRHIAAVQPKLGEAEIRQRATLIASLIEGLLVVSASFSEKSQKGISLRNAAFEAALAIACREPG